VDRPNPEGDEALRAADHPSEADRSGQSQDPGRDGRDAGKRSPRTASPRESSQPARGSDPARARDRSAAGLFWYRFVKYLCAIFAEVLMRWRATGQRNVPACGGVLLVCNHVSFLDVVFLAIPLRRPLNYVARSTLFIPVLGQFIRSVGGFPIQREGIGASGMKETLRRLRAGGNRGSLSGGNPQQGWPARSPQARNRGAGRAGRGAGRPRRPGRRVRCLAAIAPAACPSSRPNPLRAPDSPR